MNRKEFEDLIIRTQFRQRQGEPIDLSPILWQWIEQYGKEQIKESHKCNGCEELIHYQYHCPNCKRLLET